MVLPLAMLMAAGGQGLQMYGQDQRSQAQDVALAKLKYAMKMNQFGGKADRDTTQAALGNLSDQWRGSQETAVEDLSAVNQRRSFDTGEAGFQDKAAGALASAEDPNAGAMAGAADNVAFQNAQVRQGIHNGRTTEALQKVLASQAGMTGMNDNYRTATLNKNDRDSQIQQRIQDMLRLQNYATGIREAALGKANADHGFDQARAASVGSGAMYLGALMGAAAPMMNRAPQAPGAPPMGQGPNNAPGANTPVGTDPYPSWYDQNDPNGMDPYATLR